MSGNQPARIRQGRESQTASARRERAAAQLASTRGRGRGRRVRVPQDLVDSSSPSDYRSRLARVSSSRQREEEDDDEEEEEDLGGRGIFFNLAVYLSPFFIILPFISRLFVFFVTGERAIENGEPLQEDFRSV